MTQPSAGGLADLPGVGDVTLRALARLRITRPIDALLHLPTRYEDRSRITRFADLLPAATVALEGRVLHARTGGGGALRVRLVPEDAEGQTPFDLRPVTLVFFHVTRPQAAAWREGRWVRAWGDTRLGPHGLELAHPEYTLRDERTALPPLPTHLIAVYPSTEGLTQHRLREVVRHALAQLEHNTTTQQDASDAFFAAQAPRALSFLDCLRALHQPALEVDPLALLQPEHPARRRLAAEELAIRAAVLQRARRANRSRAAPPCRDGDELARNLRAQLPFTLTAAQDRVLAEVDADVRRTQPMQRLLQGDVGSGKTAVAALAAARVIGCGYQVAVMAPTEVLAHQHGRVFAQWFEPLGVATQVLVGRANKRQRDRVGEGTAKLIVGTQALISDALGFARLGLVVIDEQHRFGVRQRLLLVDKSGATTPHQLVLTATPIPRTLAQTAYADLDLSVIDAKPAGRAAIRTVSVANSRRSEVVDRLARQLRRGAQAYWVCPLIENSEKIAAAAAEDRVAELRATLPDLSIGLVHGRMSAEDKRAAMASFETGETRLLVATTVIEVGIDVPAATLMIIENSERLGLAQLHQLRGRVGRGHQQSHCVLLYQPPLGSHARARLAALRASNDGFYLAEQDLALRGPGELLGTRQTGEIELRVADLLRDAPLLDRAQAWAGALADDEAAFTTLRERWLPDAGVLMAV